MKRIILITFSLLFIVFEINSKDRVDNAVADFSQHDFTKQAIVDLSGLWEFYWQQFVDETSLAATEGRLVFFPNSWSEYVLDEEHLPVFGYASYHITLKLPEQTSALGLHIPVIGSAYALYVNGQKIYGQGKPGKSLDEMQAHIRPKVVSLPELSGEVSLILHISNFYSSLPGSFLPIQFGIYQRLAIISNGIKGTCLLLVVILLICIMTLVTRIIRCPQELYLFYLIIFCTVAIINIAVYDEMIIYLFFPGISFEVLIKLLSLLPFTCGAYLLALIGFQYPAESVKTLLYAAVIYICFVVINMIFLSSYEFENFPSFGNFKLFLPPLIILSQLMFFYCFIILFFAVKHKRPSALFHFILFTVFALSGFAGYSGIMCWEVSLLAIALTCLGLVLTIYHSTLPYVAEITAAPLAIKQVEQVEQAKNDFIRLFPLSKREEHIMALLLEGKCSKTMATVLELSVRTVENYTYRIFKKCSIKSRAEIMASYYEYQLSRQKPGG